MKKHQLVSLCMILMFVSLAVSEFVVNSVSSEENPSSYVSYREECTSVIVTGSCCKDGRAILMKNRDADLYGSPSYIIPGEGYYNYSVVSDYWMGMNERGLAVMNTAMPGGTGDNGPFNVNILRNYETVDEVWSALQDIYSPIGRMARGQVGTCVGVIDRFSNGAYFEVVQNDEWVMWVNDSFRGAANSWRHDGGDGGWRCQRVESLLTDIYKSKGVIGWQDVIQLVSRDVNDQEKGSHCFQIWGYPCNDFTVSAFVAVSGESRYEGKLNCYWLESGNPPMIGMYIPIIPCYGILPVMWLLGGHYIPEKRDYAMEPCGVRYYDPERVREIQRYAFHSENYSFLRYDEFLSGVSEDLSDEILITEVQDFLGGFMVRMMNNYRDGDMNFSPEKPMRPTGVTSGEVNVEYDYSMQAVDYEGNQVYYQFDWGDNATQEWYGPYESGESASISHNWSNEGNYSIRVRAKDVFDELSVWSDPLPVSMPLRHQTLLERIFEWILQIFGITIP